MSLTSSARDTQFGLDNGLCACLHVVDKVFSQPTLTCVHALAGVFSCRNNDLWSLPQYEAGARGRRHNPRRLRPRIFDALLDSQLSRIDTRRPKNGKDAIHKPPWLCSFDDGGTRLI